jgi:site-specific recombinase XerD
MVTTIRPHALAGPSLTSLVNGFVLTKRTEGKSPKTLTFYEGNLRRFLWYAQRQGWHDDVRLINEWQIKEFLGYVASEAHRWGLKGNGSETSRRNASRSTVHHYFVVLSCFFNWVVHEGLSKENPMIRIGVAKPKPKVITPYTMTKLSGCWRYVTTTITTMLGS